MISHPLLDQLGQTGIRLGLERIRSFLTAVGEPHRAFPVVHVAGTNGKGSVCAMVTTALVRAGYRVGTTISPHVEEVNERVQIDGVPVDDATLTEVLEAVDRARWEWARAVGVEGVPLTYFEFVTAAAFLCFARRRVDVAVVEVGMGGRLDATNVVQPVVCAVPSIGLDHVADLGGTLAEIAGEKAGILKRGAPAVIGPLAPEARAVFEQRARALGVDLWMPGRDLRRERRRDGWNLATPDGGLADVRVGLQGPHQGANALVALGVLHQLRRQGFVVPDEAIRAGLAEAFIPVRLERPAPGLLVDGAHNVDGARALAAWLAEQPRPRSRILLFGAGVDREPLHLVEPLLPYVDEVVTTRCSHPKARDPMELAMALRDLDVTLSAGGSIEEALPEVYVEADETVVAGSLFVAGAARALVRAGALDGLEPGSVRRDPEALTAWTEPT